MKDLQKSVLQYRSFFESKCNYFEAPIICKNPSGCVCKAIAEVWAYIDTIVPEEFKNLSIYDFVGEINMDSSLEERLSQEEINKNEELALSAKNKIWEFCWKPPFQKNLTAQEMDQISVMDKRFAQGTNLVIHGTHFYPEYDAEHKRAKRRPRRKGKSLLAAIVLKEAIRRKMFSSNKAISFRHVSFPILRAALIGWNDQSKKDLVSEMEEIDWLVIDDIIEESHGEKSTQFLKRELDTFLTSRTQNGKPTIFVLQFNLNESDIRSELGFVFEKIVNSSNTFVVEV